MLKVHGFRVFGRNEETKGSFLLARILGPLIADGDRSSYRLSVRVTGVLILLSVISAGSLQNHRPPSFLPQVDLLMKMQIVEDLGKTGLSTSCRGAPRKWFTPFSRAQVPGGTQRKRRGLRCWLHTAW